VASNQAVKLRIELTSEDLVRDLAVLSFMALTSLELCEMPAIRIPIINTTIESSIKENAVLNDFL
jgi:hypothetical protein